MEALTFRLRRAGEPATTPGRWHGAMSKNEIRRLQASGDADIPAAPGSTITVSVQQDGRTAYGPLRINRVLLCL